MKGLFIRTDYLLTVTEPLVCYPLGRYVVDMWPISVVVFVHTHNGEGDSGAHNDRADSILRTIRADADLYKRIGMCVRLFASFGCSSENGSDS